MPPLVGRVEWTKTYYLQGSFSYQGCYTGSKTSCFNAIRFELEQTYVGECANAKILRIFLIMFLLVLIPYSTWWMYNLKKYFLGRNSQLQMLLVILPIMLGLQCLHSIMVFSFCPYYFDTSLITRLIELIYEWLSMMLLVGCDVITYTVFYMVSFGMFLVVSRATPAFGYEITFGLSMLMATSMISGFLYRSDTNLILAIKSIQLFFEALVAFRIICLASKRKRYLSKFIKYYIDDIPQIYHESLYLKEKQLKQYTFAVSGSVLFRAFSTLLIVSVYNKSSTALP